MTPTSQSTAQYHSVLEAVGAGVDIARDIAEATGLHVSTVRKRLRRYELAGVMGRWPGNGTVECPDVWEMVPPEHQEDARRRALSR